MSNIKHSPIPWQSQNNDITSGLDYIATTAYATTSEDVTAVNQSFIVMAVNYHERLRDALKAVLPLAQSYLGKAPSHPDNGKLADAAGAVAEIDRMEQR